MRKLIKLILISGVILFGIFPFLIPFSTAQEWTYNGVDTEKIPDFSVYPSECYVYEIPGNPEERGILEVTHGNVTYLYGGNGTCVWANIWNWNATSGEKTLSSSGEMFAYWNESVGYMTGATPMIIPVGNDGKVSLTILVSVELVVWSGVRTAYNLENFSINPNLYSISYWNESFNNAYMHINYSEKGIFTSWESNIVAMGNMSIYSQPAQLPPDFSFAPEHSSLTVNSTTFNLDIDIAPADNNNDDVVDTDYSMRHFQGSTWSNWGSPPSLLQWNLGPGATAGNYTITIEIKNMYGTTQEQIEIQYEPPEDGDGEPPIPGYSTILISIAILIGVSFLILKNRVKK